MFEKFTDRARRVVVHAQDEACNLAHNYIGTEHILLGLLREEEGVAGRELLAAGVTLEAVRSEVEATIGRGAQAVSGHIPFTPRTKEVLENSLREALQLGHNYIGTEHILLGLIREGQGAAVQVLGKLGVDTAGLRRQIIEAVAGPGGEAESEGVITSAGGGRRIRRLSRPAAGAGEWRTSEAFGALHGVSHRLDAIEARLAAIQRHLGIAEEGTTGKGRTEEGRTEEGHTGEGAGEAGGSQAGAGG